MTTPYYPQANSSIERFFRTLKKYVKICALSKLELSHQLQDFLRMYRNTPIRATGYTPAEMILRYNPNSKIPNLSPYLNTTTEAMYKNAKTTEEEYKWKTKVHADKEQKRSKISDLQQGDKVLLKYQRAKKNQPVFDPIPFIVKNGNSCVCGAEW